MDRRIAKAIYLLINKYHRFYGLELYLFSHSACGPGYWGFQVAACRTFYDREKTVNDEGVLSGHRQSYSLVSYLDQVSIPSWAIKSSGSQPTLELTSSTRTQEIADWIDCNMNLQGYFDAKQRYIDDWRKNTSVEATEKYVLFINLVGLVSMQLKRIPLTPIQAYGSSYGDSTTMKNLEIATESIFSKLNPLDRTVDIFGQKDYWFCRNGLALIEGRIVDVWSEYLNGMSAKQIVSKYVKYT